jgi:hypothetical protein
MWFQFTSIFGFTVEYYEYPRAFTENKGRDAVPRNDTRIVLLRECVQVQTSANNRNWDVLIIAIILEEELILTLFGDLVQNMLLHFYDYSGTRLQE